MAVPRGLVLALDLLRAPVLAETMRRQPLLPSSEILVLLRSAGGCPETLRNAVEATDESLDHVNEAVVLYLKQILLFPGSDSYRILGVDPQASQETIREHLHWMMRWLHPDRNQNSWETVFASRVLGAWEDLKSPLRRKAYDQRLRVRPVSTVPPGRPIRVQGSTRRAGIPWIATPLPRRRSGRMWIGVLVLALLVGVAAWVTMPQWLPAGLYAGEVETDTRPTAESAVPAEPASRQGDDRAGNGSGNNTGHRPGDE